MITQSNHPDQKIHSRFLPEALNDSCIKAGLLALPIFLFAFSSAGWLTMACVNKNVPLRAEPELQLREQPPVLTGFPFNPSHDEKTNERTAIRMQT